MENRNNGRALIEGPFLKGSDSFLAALVQSASDAIIGIDPRATVLSWNNAATAMLGYQASAMIGRSIWPILPHERRRGFEERLAHTLNGARLPAFVERGRTATGAEVSLSFTLSGVRDWGGNVIAASLMLRDRSADRQAVAAGRSEDGAAPSPGADRKPSFTAPILRGQRILVVEDEALIGLGLAATLENAGFEVVGPAQSVQEAIELLETKGCELAILDVNLRRGETSAPLAERLTRMRIPFLVSSAYSPDHHPLALRNAPNFPKPFGARDLVSAVQSALT